MEIKSEKLEQLIAVLNNDEKRQKSLVKEAINEFLICGHSVNEQFNDGATLLHMAVAYDMFNEVQQLLQAGARSNIKNGCGESARDIALESGNQILLQLLYKHRGSAVQLSSTSEPVGKSRDRLWSANTNKSESSDSASSAVPLYDRPILDMDKLQYLQHSLSCDMKLSALFDDYLDWNEQIKRQKLQVRRLFPNETFHHDRVV